MCGECFCIYLVCQCDGLELVTRNRQIIVRGAAVRINIECTALAYRNILSSSLIDSSSLVVFAELLPPFISISIVHAFRDSFLLSSSYGPCATGVNLLIEFFVLFHLSVLHTDYCRLFSLRDYYC